MGFFSALTGADSRKSSTGTTDTTQTQTQTGTVKNAGLTTQSTLDAGTVSLLQSLIQGPLAGGVSGGSLDANSIRTLIPQLTANTNQGDITAQILAGQAEARRQYASGEGAQIGNLTQQIGSTGNSAAALIQNQGRVDLATSLAQVAANANAAARTQRSTDLTGAMSGYQAAQNTAAGPLTQFLAAVQSLTGAQTSQTTDQTQTMDILNKVIGSTKTASVDKSSVAQGFFPTLTNLLAAIPSGGAGG